MGGGIPRNVEVFMGREIVRQMVEDFWRAMIPAMQNGGSVQEIGQRFEENVQTAAAQLPPIEGAAFIQAIEAEREKMIAEYQANPAALKRRLGLALGVDAPHHSAHSRGQQHLGGLVVETAVRATIWAAILRLFR
jgi:hypothetical protein